MKKIILFLALLNFSVCLMAQTPALNREATQLKIQKKIDTTNYKLDSIKYYLKNPVSNAWKIGGNTIAATKKFGSIDGHDVSLIANNVEVARLKLTGEFAVYRYITSQYNSGASIDCYYNAGIGVLGAGYAGLISSGGMAEIAGQSSRVRSEQQGDGLGHVTVFAHVFSFSQTQNGDGVMFTIKTNNSDQLVILTSGIPTSAAGLASGTIYSNSGILTLAP